MGRYCIWAPTNTMGVMLCITFVMMMSSTNVSARRYIVGGNMGWFPTANHTLWAANQTFYVGDWLFFVYDRKQNDVVEVNLTNYMACIGEHPIHNYTMGVGRDVVPLKDPRDYYFISSKASCHGGMKLHIRVNNPPPSPPLLAAPAKTDHPFTTTVLAASHGFNNLKEAMHRLMDKFYSID